MLKRLKQTELITGRRKSDQCALVSNEANRRRSEEEKRNNVGVLSVNTSENHQIHNGNPEKFHIIILSSILLKIREKN